MNAYEKAKMFAVEVRSIGRLPKYTGEPYHVSNCLRGRTRGFQDEPRLGGSRGGVLTR
jgi:hypothetical protein